MLVAQPGPWAAKEKNNLDKKSGEETDEPES